MNNEYNMNTTAFVIDILIIGYQVFAWFILIILKLLGYSEINFDLLRDSTLSIFFIITVISYCLGIIFDYIIAWLFNLCGLEGDLYKKENNRNVIDILTKYPETHKFLDNHFSRLRVARATLFNIPIITFSIVLFSFNFSYKSLLISDFIIIAIGIILTVLSYLSWKKRRDNYKYYLSRAFELLDDNEQKLKDFDI